MNNSSKKDTARYEGFTNPIDASTETLAIDFTEDNDSVKKMPIATVIGLYEEIIKEPIKLNLDKVESQAKDCDKELPQKYDAPPKENLWAVTLQIFVPFMVAGCGTIGAGLILGNVEESPVFKEIKALFILVPAIIGLKGNLDMCLASRMSTQANLGTLDSKKEFIKMVIGNVFLVQIQAIVASCIVSIFAVTASAIMSGDFNFHDALLLATASTVTATTSCFTLDFVLIGVIFTARKCRWNPDNLATPLAASIGDVVSLAVLSAIAGLLYTIHDSHHYIMFIILGVYIFVLLPTWIFIVRKNKYTKNILKDGWIPVISALFISGMGGLILDNAVGEYSGFVLFQPIINGIGGNLVSIQSSRISTMLHQTALPGVIPAHTKQWIAPWTAFFSGLHSAKTARLLIVMSIPGQIVFVLVADAIYNGGQLAVTVYFVLTYLAVFLMQLSLLLYIAHLMIHTMWSFKIDPDNSSIPYLTALGDLFGTCLLFLGFMFLYALGKEYTPL